jgi:hypothetical protein
MEVGIFSIDPARAGAFAPVAADIRSAFVRGEIGGLRSFHLAPAIEDVGRWAVLVGWDSIDDHARFVASEEGQRQRTLLVRFVIGEPEIFHLSLDDVTQGLR